MLKGNEFLENSSSESSDNESFDDKSSNISSNRMQYKFFNNRETREDFNKSTSSC